MKVRTKPKRKKKKAHRLTESRERNPTADHARLQSKRKLSCGCDDQSVVQRLVQVDTKKGTPGRQETAAMTKETAEVAFTLSNKNDSLRNNGYVHKTSEASAPANHASDQQVVRKSAKPNDKKPDSYTHKYNHVPVKQEDGPDSESTVTTQSELVLQTHTLDDMDTSQESESLSQPEPTKRNGISRPIPRRAISFPVRPTKVRSRTDSVTSSKWTSIKHAVRFTNSMAKQQKSRQDIFMEK